MSSPDASPSSRAYTSPSPPGSPKVDLSVTPKSKIAALLAQFSDSDSDGQAEQPKQQTKPISRSSKSPSRNVSNTVDSEDDDEDVIIRHRAKPTKQAIIADDSDIDMEDAGKPEPQMSAADRVRKSIFGNGLSKTNISQSSDEGEDEEETPKQPRRRILKKKSSPVQSPTGSPAHSVTKLTSPIPRFANSDSDEVAARPKKQKGSKKSKDKSKSKKTKKSKKQAPVMASGSEASSLGSDSDDMSLGSLDSDDSPEALAEGSRLMQLVNQKRQANQEKEAVEEAKRKARLEAAEEMREELAMLSGGSGSEVGKRSKKTKQPSVRKASKKALFEMQAETQRMARNMNLVLEPAPRKKFPVSDLWAIFGATNPNPPRVLEQPETSGSSAPATSEVEQSSPLSSVGESAKPAETIESIVEPSASENPFMIEGDVAMKDSDSPLLEPSIQESTTTQPAILDKGKGKAKETDASLPEIPIDGKLNFLSKQPKTVLPNAPKAFKVTIPKPSLKPTNDSDSDDLEILPPPIKAIPKKIAASDPMRDLKQLARLTSPDKKRKGRPGTAAAFSHKDWLADLQKKARDQIKADEEERKDALRAQGIYIPTQEEKIKEALIVEDLVEKARQEALEQKEREKRQEARERGIKLADLTDDSGEDDGDWLESGAEEEEEAGEDLSGSEEDEVEVEGSEDEEMASDLEKDKEQPGSPTSAQRPSSPIRLSEVPEMMESDDEPLGNTKAGATNPRRHRARAVVSDDEEDDRPTAQESITQVPSSMQSPQKPVPFANMQQASLPLGLTQMFNSSIQSQPDAVASSIENQEATNVPFAGMNAQAPVMGLTQMFESSIGTQDDASKAANRMDILRGDIPEDLNISQIPLEPGFRDTQAETQGSLLDLSYSQSQIQYEPESILETGFGVSTQMSDFPDPTPDTGFQYNPAAAPPRFLTRSETMDSINSLAGKESLQSGLTEPTVILSPEATAHKPKKGRLIRKKRVDSDAEESEHVASDNETILSDVGEPTSAFDVLGKKPSKPVEAFDKKKSKAKDMFEEAAEESEDEYAGLGGGSDDDSDDDNASELEDLIDNETKDSDDRKHAEYFMQKTLAEDEKNVQKLMKDITHGNLRKKRGQGYDLSDDSDEESYRRERRRAKHAAERKRLLMQHANISEIADNPKRQAFLSLIDGGREESGGFLDDEEDFDFAVHESSGNTDSQSADKAPDSQPILEAEEKVESGNPRRTGKKRKTKTLLEVQRSVSSLLDDGISNSIVEESSDSDLEIEGIDSINKRRRVNVIDRVAVKRSATTTSETAKMAFYQGSKMDPTGQFRIPTLVRRATTQVVETTTTTAPRATVETTTSMKRVKAVGASINFQYREAAKQKNLEKATNSRKKEEQKVMGARRANAASVFNAGGFS
ncbi:hypothetical protein ABW19_dt0201814 [Dactylella cylindrospora]|nr:hypothetical protein ABW19_dt0201814 [Dactylella cylindrospora]